MNTKDIYVGASPEEVAALITGKMVSLARSSKHPVHIALSGGSTPDTLFAYWRKRPKDELKNLGVRFWWVDERLVPEESTESNFGNAYRHFFGPEEYPSELLHPITYRPELSSEEAARAYDAEVRADMSARGASVPFDLVILGVGDDGHTSSLFPGQDLFERKAYYISSVNPYNGVLRVALSYGGILSAPEVLFHVLGEKKRDILARVTSPRDEADAALPAAFVMKRAGRVSVFTDIEL